MQISNSSQALAFALPLQRDAARERYPSEQGLQPQGSSAREAPREVRDVEEIQTARRIFNQFRSNGGDLGVLREDARQQKAAAAYRSLQTQDERAYVSAVLGIDVYA
jgi:hypothetical protein